MLTVAVIALLLFGIRKRNQREEEKMRKLYKGIDSPRKAKRVSKI